MRLTLDFSRPGCCRRTGTWLLKWTAVAASAVVLTAPACCALPVSRKSNQDNLAQWPGSRPGVLRLAPHCHNLRPATRRTRAGVMIWNWMASSPKCLRSNASTRRRAPSRVFGASVFVMNADGSNERKLIAGTAIGSFAWGPDSTAIAHCPLSIAQADMLGQSFPAWRGEIEMVDVASGALFYYRGIPPNQPITGGPPAVASWHHAVLRWNGIGHLLVQREFDETTATRTNPGQEPGGVPLRAWAGQRTEGMCLRLARLGQPPACRQPLQPQAQPHARLLQNCRRQRGRAWTSSSIATAPFPRTDWFCATATPYRRFWRATRRFNSRHRTAHGATPGSSAGHPMAPNVQGTSSSTTGRPSRAMARAAPARWAICPTVATTSAG